MLKKLAILAVSAIAAVSVAGQPNQGSSSKQSPAAQSQPAVVTTNAPNKQNDGQTNQSKANADPPQRNAPSQWPEWCLVVVGIITCGVIGWQAKETRKAAEGAKESAAAALLNAQAIINTERPWLLITIELFDGMKGLPSIVAKNCGRTPAKLLSYSRETFKFVTDDVELPAEPEYEKITDFTDPIIMLPGETRTLGTISEQRIETLCGTAERFQEARSGELIVYIYGSIYYRDLIDTRETTIHESRWCCSYVPQFPIPLMQDGPEGYNRYT